MVKKSGQDWSNNTARVFYYLIRESAECRLFFKIWSKNHKVITILRKKKITKKNLKLNLAQMPLMTVVNYEYQLDRDCDFYLSNF